MEAAGSIPVASATLTHYIIVRRNLPYGVICAMVAHAAGESFYLFGQSRPTLRTPVEAHALAGNGGGNPSSGTTQRGSSVKEHSASVERSVVQVHPALPLLGETTVVVLAVDDEAALARLMADLRAARVAHVPIYEPDPPYDGALMAIGLLPADRRDVAPYLSTYPLLTAPA